MTLVRSDVISVHNSIQIMQY